MALINLKKEMAGANISIEAIAAEFGIHRNTAANKIEGNTRFTVDEAFKIKNRFFPSLGMAYLFREQNKE